MKRLLFLAALLFCSSISSRAVEVVSDTAVFGFTTDFLSYRNATSKGWNFGNSAANAPTVTLLGTTLTGNLGVNDAATGITFTTAPLTYAIGGFTWTGAPEQAARDSLSKGGLHGGSGFFVMKLAATVGKTYIIDILALDAFAPSGGRVMDVLVDGVMAKNDWLVPQGSPFNRVLRLRTVADADGIDLRLDRGLADLSGNPAISAVALTEEVASPPVIGTAPRSQTQPIGGTATFSVVAGGAPLTYQWRKGTVPIGGATAATLTISPVAAGDAASYDVVVMNAQGSVTSSAATLATVVPLAPAASGILQNLAGYWRFDETMGGTAADTSGQHNSGVLTNFSAATNAYWTAGKVGGALRFAAGSTGEHVIVPNFPKTAANYSISAWVWADSRPVWASIVKNWYGEFHFGLESGTGELSNYIGLTSTFPNAKEAGVFPTGSWQHVACTADGANLRVFRNGLQVAATAYSGALFTPPQALSIGAKIVGASTDSHWQGLIDDVALWNRALSANEIYNLFAAGAAGLDITNATPPAPPTALVINEYMADNVGGIEDEDRDSSDWIELYNGTAAAVNLDGYYLRDSSATWRFPAVTLNAGQYLLVWASGKNRRIAGQPLHTNFQIDPDGEDLKLVAPDGVTIVHSYNAPFNYVPATPTQWVPSETNVSVGLVGNVFSVAYFPVATPGYPNVAPRYSGGAQIRNTQYIPAAPTAGQAITVSAFLRAYQSEVVGPDDDPNYIYSATLHYRLMYGPEQTVAMNDSGINGDTTPNDLQWTAQIPASLGTTAGQMVRWYITTQTIQNTTARWPRYLHSESPQYLGTVIADPGITSPLPVIHRFVENAAAAELITGTRCEMFYDGEFYDNCFTRIRGNTSIGWPKKSYKVEFNKGHKFRLRATQGRVDEFDLNTTFTDKSYVRAQMVSEMYRATGLATPEIFPVHVRQNGAFYSVALYVEQPDGDFLGRYGLDPDGSYYKAVGDHGACDFTAASAFDKKTRPDEGYADLDALVTAMGLTGTTLETWLFDNLDVPQVVNFMAGVAITQNIDASNKNYFMYRDSDGSREWMFIPWDLDLSLGPDALNTDTIVYAQNSPSTPACASHPFLGVRPWQLQANKFNRLQEAIVANPRTRAMLVRRIRGMNDQFLATNWFQNRMDVLKPTLQADVDADHAKWGANSHFNWTGGGIVTLTQAMDRIKNEYLAPRVGYLMTTHAAPETLNFSTGVGNAGIPASQPAAPGITFGAIEANPASGIQDQEFIELRNTGTASVDMSGWALSGGVTFTFKGGTVVLPGESIYVTPNRYAFRQRTTGPRGAERRFVTGDASGHLSNLGETLTVKNVAGTTIASITLPATPSPAQQHLRITELHYHPPGDDLAEFIELQNTSTTVTLDLTGIHFSDGVEFAFTASTLTPGERIFVVRNTAAFTAAFGAGFRIAGEFANDTNLSDGGEHVALDDAGNSTIQEVTYNDTAPWPLAADGSGSSLHFILGSTEAPGVPEAVRWFAFAPNPGSVPADTDGDGQSNLTEWTAGTEAGNAASRFVISSTVKNGDGSISGTFSAASGKTYRVFTSPDLVTWTPLGAVITPVTSGAQTFTDPMLGTGARFYKVVTPAP